jgi:hypothetical protein
MTTTGIPWPAVAFCDCGGVLTVQLRDRLGAEMDCPVCRAYHVAWFTAEETERLDNYWLSTRGAES